MDNQEKREGIDLLRHAVESFNYCRENFFDGRSVKELLKIYDAWMRSEWDFYPDQWTARQVEEAIRQGRAPTWDANERPTYS